MNQGIHSLRDYLEVKLRVKTLDNESLGNGLEKLEDFIVDNDFDLNLKSLEKTIDGYYTTCYNPGLERINPRKILLNKPNIWIYVNPDGNSRVSVNITPDERRTYITCFNSARIQEMVDKTKEMIKKLGIGFSE